MTVATGTQILKCMFVYRMFNSGSSGSETSGSECASVESEVTSSTLRTAPSGFTKPLNICFDPRAEVAAILSYAVYDPASILKPKDQCWCPHLYQVGAIGAGARPLHRCQEESGTW